MAPTRENLAPRVVQRVARELRQLVQAPPNGIRYLPQEDEVLTDIRVEIAGPENTPYDGGFFQVRLTLSDGFPQAPPKAVFLTKIFHPNIATNGDICVNTLKKDWTPELGIAHVLQVIRCLLIVPFPESSLNDEAGRLFMESYDEYARRAKLWTNIHAPKTSAAKTTERGAGDKKAVANATPARTKDENTTNAASSSSAAADKGGKQHDDPETSGETDTATSKPDGAAKAVAKVSTSSATSLPLTKKRTSPTSTDALAAQKKKSTLKKGIKRL